MKVPWARPFLDQDVIQEVMDTLADGWVGMGNRVKLLETILANHVEREHAVAVTNGTVALDLALELLGIRPGNEVIVPAMTYAATVSAVIRRGALPVFADIDPMSCNISPSDVARKLSSRTACIIPIDYGGNPASHLELQDLADSKKIPVLLDGAQSISGMYKGRPLCKWGTVSTTSLHAAKLFTTIEGGMIFTDDYELAHKARVKRNQGEDPKHKYLHVELGLNARLTDLQAAVGLAQVKRWDKIVSKRQQIASAYSAALHGSSSVILPITECGHSRGHVSDICCQHGWFLFPVLVSERDLVISSLRQSGVETRICYPLPMYKQPFYFSYRRDNDGSNSCPAAEWVTKHVLNLPMYHQMGDAELSYVIENLNDSLVNLPQIELFRGGSK